MSASGEPLPPGHFIAGDIVDCGSCKQIVFFDDPSSDEDDLWLADNVLWRTKNPDRLCFACGLPIISDWKPLLNEDGTPVDPFADRAEEAE